MKYAITFAVLLGLALAMPGAAQAPVSTSAEVSEYEYEWTPGLASTTYRGAPDGNARAFYVQNRSTTATCYVSFDAQAATTTGGRGYKLGPGDEKSWDIIGAFASSMRAACTAATAAGAALFTSWWK